MFDNHSDYPENWFKDWFNETYLTVYRHRDDSEAGEFISRWPLWDRLNRSGWALDVGCGSGRYAREIARRGLKVMAVDLSQVLLKKATARLDFVSHPFYVRADMRNIPASGGFSLLVSLFTSFGYFKSDDDNLELLERWSQLLDPGGFFILDVPNRSYVVNNVGRNPVTKRELSEISIREEKWLNDSNTRVFKRITVWGDCTKKEYMESVRLFDYSEINRTIASSGFQLLCPTWGDYQGNPLVEESPRMIFFSIKH